MFPLNTLWIHGKLSVFLILWGIIEREHWADIGYQGNVSDLKYLARFSNVFIVDSALILPNEKNLMTLHSFSKMREKWPQRVINQNDKRLPQNFSQINLSRNQDWFFETNGCEFFSHVKISHDVMVL